MSWQNLLHTKKKYPLHHLFNTLFSFVLQIPLSILSKFMEKRYGPRSGNIVVWASLILGQPLCIMMYYHDYVITHIGEDLIDRYGHVWTNTQCMVYFELLVINSYFFLDLYNFIIIKINVLMLLELVIIYYLLAWLPSKGCGVPVALW